MFQPIDPAGIDQEIEPSRLLLDSSNLRLLDHISEDILETPADEIGTSPIQDAVLKAIRTDGMLPKNCSISYESPGA
jgi:hypothetical protein